MKDCLTCGQTKDLNEFYKHAKMFDGYLNHCKECKKSYAREAYDEKVKDPEFVLSERKRTREKYHRLNYRNLKPNKEVMQKRRKNYREKYPEKAMSRTKVTKIKRPIGFHLHHWSYNEHHYKDVIELRIKDHYLAHRKLIYNQKRKMYEDLDGNLLDTKRKHVEYLKSINAITTHSPLLTYQ